MVEYETAVRIHRLAKLRFARQLDQAGQTIQAVADSSKVHSDLIDLSEQVSQAVLDSGVAHAGLLELSKKTRQGAIDTGDSIEAEGDLISSQQSTVKRWSDSLIGWPTMPRPRRTPTCAKCWTQRIYWRLAAPPGR